MSTIFVRHAEPEKQHHEIKGFYFIQVEIVHFNTLADKVQEIVSNHKTNYENDEEKNEKFRYVPMVIVRKVLSGLEQKVVYNRRLENFFTVFLINDTL